MALSNLKEFISYIRTVGVSKRNNFIFNIIPNANMISALQKTGTFDYTKGIELLCHSANIPSYSFLTEDNFYDGPNKRHYVYDYEKSSLSLSLYLDQNLKMREFFEVWKKLIFNEKRVIQYYDNYSCVCALTILDNTSAPIATYQFTGVFPKQIAELSFDWNSVSEKNTQNIEFSFETMRPKFNGVDVNELSNSTTGRLTNFINPANLNPVGIGGLTSFRDTSILGVNLPSSNVFTGLVSSAGINMSGAITNVSFANTSLNSLVGRSGFFGIDSVNIPGIGTVTGISGDKIVDSNNDLFSVSQGLMGFNNPTRESFRSLNDLFTLNLANTGINPSAVNEKFLESIQLFGDYRDKIGSYEEVFSGAIVPLTSSSSQLRGDVPSAIGDILATGTLLVNKTRDVTLAINNLGIPNLVSDVKAVRTASQISNTVNSVSNSVEGVQLALQAVQNGDFIGSTVGINLALNNFGNALRAIRSI